MLTMDINALPHLTTEQMREVDRAMIEDYHIELVQMMENAGLNLARLARRRFLEGDPRGKAVTVLAGSGGNGGGGLVCARRLHNWGAQVQVVTTYPFEGYRGVPAHQLDVLRRMGVAITAAMEGVDGLPAPDLVIDAVIGYSLSGAPRGAAATLIAWANAQGAPVLSLDVPSGVDTASGQVYSPTVRAAATLTLALPKAGLLAPEAAPWVGELYLADISVPPELYARMGLEVGPIFAEGEILRLA